MGTITDTQPPQLTVDNTGNVTFNTTNVGLGYWNTQMKISDGLSYVVVDFIILIIVRLSLPLDLILCYPRGWLAA